MAAPHDPDPDLGPASLKSGLGRLKGGGGVQGEGREAPTVTASKVLILLFSSAHCTGHMRVINKNRRALFRDPDNTDPTTSCLDFSIRAT